ncbi:MAG TPA: DUF2442 domain-containing protein [Anaerolineales bacterium]|nr:DUF2442 domain-containing protein [Anaerolineales bacterium]
MIVLVHSVKLIKNFEVELEFSTGEKKVVDLEPLLRGPIFEPVRNNPEVFRSIRVDEELGTVVWENGADIDPDVLYGTQIPAWMEDEEKVQV